MDEEKYRKWMEAALEEAILSFRGGNGGFGTVIVEEGRVAIKAHDTGRDIGDPTTHSVTKAIREYSERYGSDFSLCTLYTTCEPCQRCMQAMIEAGIPRLVFSVSTKEALEQGMNPVDLECEETTGKLPGNIEIISGVLREKCLPLYTPEVRNQVKQLLISGGGIPSNLRNSILRSRLDWIERNRENISGKLEGTDPEKAYRLLLIRLGISEDEAPIVYKTDEKLVFHSCNFCPTLEACILLGLDTRIICRGLTEKPTDRMIKKINPRLRFTRNYNHLRPRCSECEEMIILRPPSRRQAPMQTQGESCSLFNHRSVRDSNLMWDMEIENWELWV